MPRSPRPGGGSYRKIERGTVRKATRKTVSGKATTAGLVGQKVGVGKAIRPPASPRPDLGKRTSRSRRRV